MSYITASPDMSFFFVSKVSQEMKKFYDTVYDQAMLENLQQDKKSAVSHALKVFHETVRANILKDLISFVFMRNNIKCNLINKKTKHFMEMSLVQTKFT